MGMWKKPRPRKKLNDYYAVLGVSSGASPKAVQFAFWKAARRLHPDVNLDPNALEQYKEVVEAYQTLKSPDTRADYDARLITQYCLFLLGGVEADKKPRKKKYLEFIRTWMGENETKPRQRALVAARTANTLNPQNLRPPIKELLRGLIRRRQS